MADLPAAISVTVRFTNGAVHEYEVRAPEAPYAELASLLRHVPRFVPADGVIVSARDLETVLDVLQKPLSMPPTALLSDWLLTTTRAVEPAKRLRQVMHDAEMGGVR